MLRRSLAAALLATAILTGPASAAAPLACQSPATVASGAIFVVAADGLTPSTVYSFTASFKGSVVKLTARVTTDASGHGEISIQSWVNQPREQKYVFAAAGGDPQAKCSSTILPPA